MKTSRVVIDRHIFPDIGNSFLPGLIQRVTDPFPFQAAKEPFYRRVVPVVTLTAHTADLGMGDRERERTRRDHIKRNADRYLLGEKGQLLGVLSDLGYRFVIRVDIQPYVEQDLEFGEVTYNTLYFELPSCEGQAYVADGNIYQGRVFQTPNLDDRRGSITFRQMTPGLQKGPFCHT